MLIGQRIRERRLDLNMTQEELAKALNYKSKSTINKIELGKNDIPLSKVVEFANALHTSVSYLMEWTDDPSPHDGEERIDYDKAFSPYFAKLITSFPIIELVKSMDEEQEKRLMSYARFLLSEEHHGNED